MATLPSALAALAEKNMAEWLGALGLPQLLPLMDEWGAEHPEDLAHLDYDAQQTAIKIRAGWQMFLGTVLVLVFSDPMVDCLAALGERTGIPSFYISFVLAPLASNASELLAAYRFALKKTKATITVSLSQLEGAAISESLSQSAVAPVICGRLPLSVKP